ncbi:hypothetical protein [Streptomyces sp. NPDC002209]|uniref:hypothetical protein n=1 Tax=Streptomyces sp. NPDC002209 TaxID=3364638 RepID=UPI00368DD76D
MIKKLLQRGLLALALACLPVLSSVPAAHADARPPAVPGTPGVGAPKPLFEVIDMIPAAAEEGEG